MRPGFKITLHSGFLAFFYALSFIFVLTFKSSEAVIMEADWEKKPDRRRQESWSGSTLTDAIFYFYIFFVGEISWRCGGEVNIIFFGDDVN